MFFDNMIFEFDSAFQKANSDEKPKKAQFYFNRRITDLTESE